MTAPTTEVRRNARREVLTYVRKHPGATAEDMAIAYGSTPSIMSTAAKALCDQGVLARQRHGRPFRYFIPDRAPTANDEEEPQTDKQTIENMRVEMTVLDRKTIAEMRTDLTALEAEIDALEAWMADAIKRYPDLGPVDPLLVKAREIAARGDWLTSPDADIIDGGCDSHPIVQAIYMTLQEA